MKHLINPLDFSVEETEELLLLAEDIAKDRSRYSEVCHGKKLATLFYEPSTRTRLSFEAAMLNLGGNVLGFASGGDSSASKGRALPIRFASFPVMRISSPCAIKGRRRPGGRNPRFCSGNQCRRWRTSASDPDIDRPSDHSLT